MTRFFFLLAMLMFASAFAQEKHPVSLKAGLLNIRNLLPFRISIGIESRPLCRDMQQGCLFIGYQDSLQVARAPLFYESLVVPRGDEVFLLELGRNREIQRAGLLDNEKLKERARDTIRRVRAGIVRETLSQSQIESMILSEPASFDLLPDLYSSLQRNSPGSEKVLYPVFEKALVLTLSTLTNAADSRSLTYAYGNDNLIPKGSLLKVDWLYEELKKIGRWPRIVALTPAKRAQLKGHFQERTKDGRGWKALAVYSASDNTILLDYTSNFFEAVYTLEHELWHVAFEHSTYAQALRYQIQNLLLQNIPEADDTLRGIFASLTVQNERIAFSNQNLLFHFAGHLTGQWSIRSQPSANAWHNAMFGDQYLKSLFIPREQRLKPPQNLIETRSLRLSRQEIFDNLGLSLSDNVVSEFDFLNSRYNFGTVNLETLYGADPNQLNIVSPRPVILKCSDIQRIIRVLPDGWKYGIPFLHVLRSGERCTDLPAQWPGGDGTHPGLGGDGTHPVGAPRGGDGTHPGFSGFPSINGLAR